MRAQPEPIERWPSHPGPGPFFPIAKGRKLMDGNTQLQSLGFKARRQKFVRLKAQILS